jgi:hypothetical protein
MTRRIARIPSPTGGELHLDLEPRRPVRVEITVPDGPPDEATLDRLAEILDRIISRPALPPPR